MQTRQGNEPSGRRTRSVAATDLPSLQPLVRTDPSGGLALSGISSGLLPGAAPRSSLVVRSRLVERMRRRFEARLMLVVGGGGSGKTTLLAHAMSEDSDHLDVWYPCRAGDRAEERLLAGLVDACRGSTGAVPADHERPPIEILTELVLAESPRQVCLVIDDAHVLGAAAPLAELLAALPMNGHLLVAGRVRPNLATARLDAAGQLEVIEQDELLLTTDELIDFANLRGVDVAQLADAGGWPAFVELASSGTEARSRSYLDEEALAGIDPNRRAGLAAFAFVGGGDDEIALAVSGMTLADLIADLPLVRWSGEQAQLHDLWRDLLVPDLDAEQRHQAAVTAAAVARAQRDIDRAVDLSASVDDWADVAASIRRAVIDGIVGGLRADQIRRWRRSLPTSSDDPALVQLLDGLLERERDPTSDDAVQLLDAASRRFAAGDDPELELVALTQLGYLARIGGDPEVVTSVSERFELLAERHPPAQPFLAVGAAWTALTEGDPARQLSALMSISDDALPPIWQITRRHLIANALFNLGRAAEGLEVVPTDIDTLPVPIPGALITESQCLWYSGRPEVAHADPPRGASDRHGARDRFIAAGWEALMCCASGEVERARAAIDAARRYAGEQPGLMVMGQLAGLNALLLIAEGRDDEATETLSSIVELAPLGAGFSEHVFRHHFAHLYLLVPSSRAFWDEAPMIGTMARVRAIVQAFAAARDGDLGPLSMANWPEPGLIAAYVPVGWAIELALRGTVANRQEARRLAGWLCEHWQRPARSTLASWLDDEVLGAAARDVLAHTPTPPAQTISIRTLGYLDVCVDGPPTADPNWRRERVQALLAWLVLHPETSRDRAATAVWPDLSREKSAKNLRTTLNYLNGVLEPTRGSGDAPWFIRSAGERLTLHPDTDVDLWRFRELLDRADRAEHEGHPRDALPVLLDALAEWHGDLAADLDHPWLELERIHVRSRYVRAACRAAELLVATGQPDRAIAAVRPALDVDPYHERSYRALATAYRSIDDHTSARAILERGAEQLGDELI